jgi:KaiC/GvpD/RAD55 family RecA-like ATPase
MPDSYGFLPRVESLIALHGAADARFWGLVAPGLSPDGLATEPARLVIQAAKAMAAETGRGPGSALLVVHRLRRWREEGRVTDLQIGEVERMLRGALEDDAQPSSDAVLTEIITVLRRRLQREALDAGLREFSHRGDFARIEELLQQARRLGTSDTLLGGRLIDVGVERIKALQGLGRLPTGIFELDALLGGGLYEKNILLWAARSGGGKSMALNHMVAHAMALNVNVALATMELSEAVQYARMIANLTDIPTDDILVDMADEAHSRLLWLYRDGRLGGVTVRYFSPSTTPADLRAWLVAERDAGLPVDFLGVDYLDKMGSEKQEAKNGNEYTRMRFVMEGLIELMFKDPVCRWVASATQIKTDAARKGETKIVEGEDAADSQHKLRATDVFVSLNPRQDGAAISYYVAKNRMGRAGRASEPVPHQWELGRMCQVERPAGWPTW